MEGLRQYGDSEIAKIIPFTHQRWPFTKQPSWPGRIAQWVTCLATVLVVPSSIPVRSHAFVEIDHELISMIILLPSADSFKKGCCQLQAKVCAQITG